MTKEEAWTKYIDWANANGLRLRLGEQATHNDGYKAGYEARAEQKEEQRILSHNLFRGCEKANRILYTRIKQKNKECDVVKDLLLEAIDWGFEKDKEIAKLKEETEEGET